MLTRPEPQKIDPTWVKIFDPDPSLPQTQESRPLKSTFPDPMTTSLKVEPTIFTTKFTFVPYFATPKTFLAEENSLNPIFPFQRSSQIF